jgi:hypothetical protein
MTAIFLVFGFVLKAFMSREIAFETCALLSALHVKGKWR